MATRSRSSPRSREDETPPAGTGPGGRDGGTLTHLDEQGRARMVDVTAKPADSAGRSRPVAPSSRRPTPPKPASPRPRAGCRRGRGRPHCGHPGRQADVVAHSPVPSHPNRSGRSRRDGRPHRIEISAITEIVERTGVEMEALTACAVAALTLVTALIDVDPEASDRGTDPLAQVRRAVRHLGTRRTRGSDASPRPAGGRPRGGPPDRTDVTMRGHQEGGRAAHVAPVDLARRARRSPGRSDMTRRAVARLRTGSPPGLRVRSNPARSRSCRCPDDWRGCRPTP